MAGVLGASWLMVATGSGIDPMGQTKPAENTSGKELVITNGAAVALRGSKVPTKSPSDVAAAVNAAIIRSMSLRLASRTMP